MIGTRPGPYRAKDTKLNRDVAIKVLPESFARDAQVLASLNHPNIAAIYGIVDLPPEGGSHVNALVMELVGGEDLSAVIARGPLSLLDALPLAKQMGLILGTAAYLAPEQATGRAVDRRADIWAFGVVWYEMLAGRRLFDAEDISETLA